MPEPDPSEQPSHGSQAWEELPKSRDQVRLAITFASGKCISRDADDCFSALCQIRQELERDGILIRCYGSSRNVYPSGMIQAMGIGHRAYQLVMHEPARMTDLVEILVDWPDVDPVTVAVQEAWFQEWLMSLGR